MEVDHASHIQIDHNIQSWWTLHLKRLPQHSNLDLPVSAAANVGKHQWIFTHVEHRGISAF